MAVSESLAQQVRARAGNRCEYCQVPAHFSSIAFEIDHSVAEQHGGKTVLSNLALACFADNHHKGPNLAGIDPSNRRKIWLFNPRRHTWTWHFRWEGAVIVGRTAIGRATVATLQMNAPLRVAQRAALIAECAFHEHYPPGRKSK
jgi:hypothetical protein